jgi:hypothetical protein
MTRKQLNKYFIKYFVKVYKRRLTPSYLKWRNNGFVSPSPQFIKTQVLKRNGINFGTWIETGTYLGDTTKFLAKNFPNSKIISLEPQILIFNFAKFRLRKRNNVLLVNGSSEEKFEGILSKIAGPVNFWLDGHFSGDITFQGDSISPIIQELDLIEKYRNNIGELAVFIDDIRDFDADLNSGYPSRDVLVTWANRNNLKWNIEQDIFIAKSRK